MAKRKNRLGIASFDASDYLDSEEVIAEYIAAALEDRNPDVFLHAVADVARARKLMDSLGVRLTVTTH
jgi:probable addiction module antidote protein